VDDGRIDILAVDKTGRHVVVELKVSRGRNRALGQLLYYMAWVDKNLGKGPCRGMIIAKEITDDLALAVRRVQGASIPDPFSSKSRTSPSASLMKGDSAISTVAAASILAYNPNPLPFLERFDRSRFPVTTLLQVNTPDLVVVSLTLTATVIRGTHGLGYAWADVEGLTSPPGRSAYFPFGGLELPRFVLHDPDSRILCSAPLTTS
jgi:Endonuclease NucS C-terminal domain